MIRRVGESGRVFANYRERERDRYIDASESEARDKSDYKSAVNGKTSLNKQLKRVFFMASNLWCNDADSMGFSPI